jgi:hypothetical protein
MAAINLGTDVDAPRGEKMENSRKDEYQKMRLGHPTVSCKGGVKIQAQPNPCYVRHHLGGCGGGLRTMTWTPYVCKRECQLQNGQAH